jgi:hypothetical protein
MPLPESLGLLPELWAIIFEKSRRLSLWDARVAWLDELLSQSRARWKPSFWAQGLEEPDMFIAQKFILFACRFKLMEMTKLKNEDVTDVSIYVYDLNSNDYVYMDEIGIDMLFEDHEEDVEEEEEDEFVEDVQDME